MRWYVAATDIDERKRAEERLQHENVVLREELDKASMFEEIVGTSPALKSVLSRISKVAPSDSTVLITGETGTGKDLVARAIHRRPSGAAAKLGFARSTLESKIRSLKIDKKRFKTDPQG